MHDFFGICMKTRTVKVTNLTAVTDQIKKNFWGGKNVWDTEKSVVKYFKTGQNCNCGNFYFVL